MKISAAIMHVPDEPERRASLSDLLRRLGSDAIAKHLTRLDIVKDTKRAGVWPTARRAWMAGGHAGATHHLLLQDDALPCRDLLAAVHVLVETMPDHPICLFDMSSAATFALAEGKHWVARSSLSSTLGIVMPIQLAMDAIRWADYCVTPDLVHDDVRFSMYLQSIGRLVMVTAPSLVEHVGDKSLVGNPRYLPGRKERRAGRFLGAAASALDIDWHASAPSPYAAWSHSPSEYTKYRIR